MTDVIVKVKRLTNTAKLPKFANKYAVGADLYADEDAIITPNGYSLVKTGIAIELDENYEAQIRSRSGLASKHRVFVLNSPGTIDPDYRGEIIVILYNASPNLFKVNKGDRIAQLVIKKRYNVQFVEVEELSNTERGDKGFGSTGLK